MREKNSQMYKDSIRQELRVENQLTLLEKLIGQKLRTHLRDLLMVSNCQIDEYRSHNFRKKAEKI